MKLRRLTGVGLGALFVAAGLGVTSVSGHPPGHRKKCGSVVVKPEQVGTSNVNAWGVGCRIAKSVARHLVHKQPCYQRPCPVRVRHIRFECRDRYHQRGTYTHHCHDRARKRLVLFETD